MILLSLETNANGRFFANTGEEAQGVGLIEEDLLELAVDFFARAFLTIKARLLALPLSGER
jgi:hypothetical protein